jgi:primase-polymerase (primpol)-like protein
MANKTMMKGTEILKEICKEYGWDGNDVRIQKPVYADDTHEKSMAELADMTKDEALDYYNDHLKTVYLNEDNKSWEYLSDSFADLMYDRMVLRKLGATAVELDEIEEDALAILEKFDFLETARERKEYAIKEGLWYRNTATEAAAV